MRHSGRVIIIVVEITLSSLGGWKVLVELSLKSA